MRLRRERALNSLLVVAATGSTGVGSEYTQTGLEHMGFASFSSFVLETSALIRKEPAQPSVKSKGRSNRVVYWPSLADGAGGVASPREFAATLCVAGMDCRLAIRIWEPRMNEINRR